MPADPRVAPDQRWSSEHRCPICGGSPTDPQGAGIRCYGFGVGQILFCTRVETPTRSPVTGAWPHVLDHCDCGQAHDPEDARRRARVIALLRRDRDASASDAPSPGITIAQLAAAKRLPEAMLRQWGWRDRTFRDGTSVIEIPYHDPDTPESPRIRYRFALTGQGKLKWRKGTTALPYGPELLPVIREAKYVFIVEGETDTVTFWLHRQPALGVPGAGTWKPEWDTYLAGLDPIYVILEPGDSGTKMLQGMARSAHREHFKLVRFDPFKDVNELHLAYSEHEDFLAHLNAAVDRAVPWSADSQAQQAAPPAPSTAEDGGELVSVNMATVTPRNIDWLWPGRLAVGKLTIIAGDPGLGKSTIGLSLAGIITTGGNWPDGGTTARASTAILTAEDDLEDTLQPRLVVAGADLSRVETITGVRQAARDGLAWFSLSDDLRVTERWLDAHPGVTMLQIDPLSSYMNPRGRSTDTHRDNEVRGVLGPVAELAMRRRLAIFAVMHLTKASERRALYRVLGSMAFVAQARILLLVGADPDNRETRCFLLSDKMNLGKKAPALAYSVVGECPQCRVLRDERECPVCGRTIVGKIVWEAEPVHGITPDSILTSANAGDDPEDKRAADAVVLDLFATVDAVRSKDAVKDGEKAGISERSLKRAKGRLNVRSFKRGQKEWWWLAPRPEDEPTRLPEARVLHTLLATHWPVWKQALVDEGISIGGTDAELLTKIKRRRDRLQRETTTATTTTGDPP